MTAAMKIAIAAVTAIAVLAGAMPPTPAAASEQGYRAYELKTRYKKKRYRARPHRQIQYWADKLPTGSQIWWEQMDREGRGGRRR